jgi:hypothetical protein
MNVSNDVNNNNNNNNSRLCHSSGCYLMASRCKGTFDRRTAYVGFVVEKCDGKFFSEYFILPLLITIPPVLQTHPQISLRIETGPTC